MKRKSTKKNSILNIITNSKSPKIVHSIIAVGMLCLYSFTNVSINTTDTAAISYIEDFKDLAIVEMHRSGIPASIILAQGLHESNNGMSRLATEANNHFGIKCKSYWVGSKFYHKDDDYNAKGILKDSCFRKYGSSVESYVDHSNFLMMSNHYKTLFNYDKTDYTSWAKGLKKCGYATDKKYAEKLISKIDKFYLSQYDSWEDPR